MTLSASSFTLTASCKTSTLLNDALSRASTNLFPHGAGGAREHVTAKVGAGFGVLSSVQVCVTSADESLVLGVDESYTLSIPSSGVGEIHASTVYGAMHGLETLTQLVEYTYTNDSYQITATPIVIDDAPRFPWRGLMVDTARHYMPASKIIDIVDTLAQNKFNVLHWHLVDAQSFPYVVPAAPKLTDGAWHPTAIFTPQEVAAVVAYAKARGVRVVPEFDGPGHSAAWGVGYPDIVADCPAYAANINNIPLNPASSATLQVLRNVYEQAASSFSDEFIHLGGDEVVQGCWANDPEILAWMRARGYSPLDVYQYFEDKMIGLASLPSVNKSVLLWEDPFDNGVSIPHDVVIEVWRDQATLKNVTSAGYQALLAAPFYLDQQIPGNKQTFYEWEDTWKAMWAIDPLDTLSSDEAKRVLGGEAAMWAEQVMAPNFDSRVWPRASAVAERFWSPPPESYTPGASTVTRLNAHSCRMQVRGVGCGPIAPSFCLLP